jgi:GAF domain-containing protein
MHFQQERPRRRPRRRADPPFAHQAGVALERARAYEVEHEAAMTSGT